MKTFQNTIIIWIISLSFLTIGVSKVHAQGQVSIDIFYDALSPYGDWAHDSQYGEVWYPDADPNFIPYGTNGHWVMTEYGNTWVSNYSWGWAPFHYGRWIHSSHRGWGWVPGYEWGPAWVEWRSGNGYYGWAPMTPSVRVGVSMQLPMNLWVFVQSRNIYQPRLNRYWSYGHRNIYNRTTVINNT